jgi:hypothetical protein
MKHAAKFMRTQDDLGASLHTLRLIVKEVGFNYIAGLQAEIAHLEEAVRLLRDGDTQDRKTLNQLTTMLKWINTLEVKPQKGRRRDLKELDRLVRKLANQAENW